MVNPSPGVNIANQVTVPIAADGKVRLYNDSGGVDLVADLAGYLTGGLVAAGPTRVLDTRYGTGAPAARVGQRAWLTLTMPNVPRGVTGVVFNLTATNTSSHRRLRVRVSGGTAGERVCEDLDDQPIAGVNIANQVTVPIAADGKVRLYNDTGDVDLVADLAGYVTSFVPSISTVSPAPPQNYRVRGQAVGLEHRGVWEPDQQLADGAR